MDTLIQDLRYAIRALLRAPGFTITAVLTLALGIGAATAGFNLLNWVLLRPLPGVRDPGQLGLVWFAAGSRTTGLSPNNVTPTQRDAILRTAPAVVGLAGQEGATQVNVAAEGQLPRQIWAEFVTSNYLTLLGERPQLGRGFAADEDLPRAGRPVAVISDGLWRGLFGRRADILGQTVEVNGLHFRVIGVGSPGFHGGDRFDQPDLWMPGETYWDVHHFPLAQRPPESPYYKFVLRLRTGASFAQAESQLREAIGMMARADTADFDARVTATVFPGVGLDAMGREQIARQLMLVMGLAGLMLLVACANVANLLLFRRAQRRADTVVRLVLGASRGRLIRHFLAESAILGLVGAGGGVIVALWMGEAFRNLPLLRRISIREMSPDWRVLLFAVGAGLLAALGAGIAPALFGSRSDLGADLKQGGPTTVGGASRLRTGLAVVQIAVSLTLVAGAYLFARTLQSYTSIPLGFDPTGVAVFTVDPQEQGYTVSKAQEYLRTLRNQVAGLAGVEQVAFVSIPPFTGVSMQLRVRPADGSAETPPLLVTSDQVSANYFSTLRIPLVLGSGFQAGDEWPKDSTATGKAILSETLAHRLFGSKNPVGELIRREKHPLVVVGVVGDIHWNGRGGTVEPMLYEPMGQGDGDTPMLAVRSSIPAGALARQVQGAGQSLDPTLPIESRGPLSATVAASLADQTLLFRLVGILSALTLLLTIVGVYALVAYGVTTRTREFGVRMALGADSREVVRTAVRPALTIVVAGVVFGIAGAMYLTRFIAASLYGVSRLDPTALAGAALLLGVAAFLASWLPARRAADVDPMVALRAE